MPAPNPDLAQLVSLLGTDNVRLLIRTFLREYPALLKELTQGDRKTRHRIAHSLKSNARIIGARELSARMAGIEEQLSKPDTRDLTAEDIASITTAFDAVAQPLRAFADGTD